MAGSATNDISVPVNIDGSQTQVPILFEATVTLNASQPCTVSLSAAPKTLAAKVSPPMAGSYQWCWYGGDISSVTGNHLHLSAVCRGVPFRFEYIAHL